MRNYFIRRFSEKKIGGFSRNEESPGVRKAQTCLVKVMEQLPYALAHSGFSQNMYHIKNRINDWVDDCRRVFLVQACGGMGVVKECWWQAHATSASACVSWHWPICIFQSQPRFCICRITLTVWTNIHSFYPQHRVFKADFPPRILIKYWFCISLKRLQVAHISWTRTKISLSSSLKKSYCLFGPSPPLTPAIEALEMPCIWLTSFWMCSLWVHSKMTWNVGILQIIQLPTVPLRPLSVGNNTVVMQMPPIPCGISKLSMADHRISLFHEFQSVLLKMGPYM